MSDFTLIPNFSHNLKHSRSPAIPKEVNQYVLMNFGAAYYNSTDFNSRQELLKAIEMTLNQAGYNITAGGIERRLKNMKSHYRRKKADLEVGTASKVDWQYYDILHKIFSLSDEMERRNSSASELNNEHQSDPNVPSTSKATSGVSPLPQRKGVKRTRRRRKLAAVAVPTSDVDQPVFKAPQKIIDYDQPQDLSMKKPKLEEIQPVPLTVAEVEIQPAAIPDDPNQPLQYLNSFLSDHVQANQESYIKILEGLSAINDHRTALSNQILTLENRRRELDSLSFQLTNFLIIFQQIDAKENLGIYN